jgi:hypothetical protein
VDVLGPFERVPEEQLAVGEQDERRAGRLAELAPVGVDEALRRATLTRSLVLERSGEPAERGRSRRLGARERLDGERRAMTSPVTSSAATARIAPPGVARSPGAPTPARREL